MEIEKIVLIAFISYFIGAIPFGLIISRLMGRIDITKYGSGNVGTANVARTLGAKAGSLVMVFDLAKAIVSVMLANIIIGNKLWPFADLPADFQGQLAQVIAATMAMLGHNWSIFMKFRGGKGVTAYEGGWLVIYPSIALFGGVIFIPVVLITRYISLGSMMGSIGIFLVLIILTALNIFPPVYLFYAFLGTILIVYQHRENIERLRSGTERRFSLGKRNTNLESGNTETK